MCRTFPQYDLSFLCLYKWWLFWGCFSLMFGFTFCCCEIYRISVVLSNIIISHKVTIIFCVRKNPCKCIKIHRQFFWLHKMGIRWKTIQLQWISEVNVKPYPFKCNYKRKKWKYPFGLLDTDVNIMTLFVDIYTFYFHIAHWVEIHTFTF